ncbi:hypothetical protein [Parasphingorhabdus halotolerans]|uniref:hypothetical protein n=1 Tax=Parasphingorhabdus halotolerans TaxID=2725558 RepID=UPI001FE7328E|nr:hypothetical protein [Parasphingorhabdus halotolerans]
MIARNSTINSHCPWSGKPVANDSTTFYRGHPVGFCNPGCRDKFDAATGLFEDILRNPVAAANIKPADYQRRYFQFHNIWRVDDLRLKIYTIQLAETATLKGELFEKALVYIQSNLPKVRQEEGPDHRLGYAIIHPGEMATWLLIHWWAHSDIAMRLLASAEVGQALFRPQDHRRFHACVWEHIVIDHERNAWVGNMMCNDNSPDAYLECRLADGLY